MELTALTALSAIDGRYRSQIQHLDEYFSEYALIRYRVLIEVEYLKMLSKYGFFQISEDALERLNLLKDHFEMKDAQAIKTIEKTTNHDVKAVEYFIKDCLQKENVNELKEWVHFGLTSQDINNTAIPLLWKHALEFVYLPAIVNLTKQLKVLASQWAEVPMLAHTHGQPASPTGLGKELMVFVERLDNQTDLLLQVPISAKFGGATGNFNAHVVAFPKTDWIAFADDFVASTLGLHRARYTTQIEHYDYFSAGFDAMKRINTVLIDLCRDLWTYISMEYFSQKTKEGEIGSSAMPHKVNPIDFENAEGNLGIANALFEHLSSKLPVSRLQRDLTDSTVLRNVGVPFAHSILAFRSIEKGLNKLVLNKAKIEQDLNDNWTVLAEAIQTILRREKYPNPYEALKDLTRGKEKLNKSTLHRFIDALDIDEKIKAELKRITPHNYTGTALKF